MIGMGVVGGCSSQDDRILIKRDTAAGCNISWSQGGEARTKGERVWVCEGSSQCLGLHTSVGDEGLM